MRNIANYISLLFVIVAAASCGPSSKGRYISDKDTSFSADVRSISARINKDPGNAELYYRRANTFYFEKRYRDALTDIDFALLKDSTNALYHYRKAECLMGLDSTDTRKALFHYETSARLKPDFADAIFQCGRLYLARQEYDKAFSRLDELAKLDPTNTRALLYKGIGYKEMKDTLKAVEQFEKVISINGSDFDAFMQLGNLYLGEDLNMAGKYFDNALRVNEFSDEANYQKGYVLQQQGKSREAQMHYSKALEANPAHLFAYYNLAYLQLAENRTEDCIRNLKTALSLDENFAKGLHLLGFAYELKGDYANALASYENCSKIDPSNAQVKEDLEKLKNKIKTRK